MSLRQRMAAQSTTTESGIKVLSLNVWGIFNAKHVASRMAALGPYLGEFDVICLQEQFSASDFSTLLNGLPGRYHHKRFTSSVYGSGLTILSKFEITSSHYDLFPLQGRPDSITEGDYWAAKGVGLARLRLELNSDSNASWGPPRALGYADHDGDESRSAVDLLVYNTHFIAQYQKYSKLGSYERERNSVYRLSQALNMAKFIVHTARPRDPVVVCGDFNAGPDSPELKLLLSYCHAYGIHLHRAVLNDGRTNHTFSKDNPFNKGDSSSQEDMPVQLDHILVSTRTSMLHPFGDSNIISPLHRRAARESPVGVVVLSGNRDTPLPNNEGCPVSDHYGVACRVAPFHPNKPPFFVHRDQVEPGLLDDYHRSGEHFTYCANLLEKADSAARVSAWRWLPAAFLLIAGPLLAQLFLWMTGSTSWSVTAIEATILGAAGGISVAIGASRLNDAANFGSAADDLQLVMPQ